MHDLQLVGFTTDRRGLIFRTSAGARVESYVVPITDELVRLVGQLAEATPDDDPADIEVEDEPVVAVAEPRAESQLSVRDIQSRLRAGEDVARVAVEAGVDEDWIERFAPPVRAEQRRIVERALDCHLERSRGGPSSMPLRRAVGRAMADKGIAFTLAAFEAAWSARLVGHDRWTVEFTYYHRGRDRTVSWDFDAEAETLTTGDRTASQLGYVGADGEADDTTGLAVDGIIGDPEATTQIGAGSQAADARSTRNRTAKKQRAAKKKATKKKASPAKKKATKKKASPAKKRAPKKRASPARKKAAKKKASPAKKGAPKKTGPAKKRVTKKAAPAKKRATAQQVIMEPTASPKVPPAEQVPGPSASGPAGAARSRATAPAETAAAPTSIESTPRPERPATDADRTGTAPRLTRDELDRLVPAVPGPASTNGVKGREDAAPLSPEEELERLRARRVARQLAEDRTHAPAEDDRTAARRARAAERSAHTVQFRSGSAAPVRIAGATSGRPRPDAPETGNRRPTDAAADADTTGTPPPADANGAARPRSRRRRQLRAR